MSVLDLNTFNAFKESMGDDLILELIDTFCNDTKAQVAQMREALTTKDVETFRRAAHSIKSSAAFFGATDLIALARELEMMAHENNLNVGNRLEVLNEAFELVKNRLNELK